MTKMTKMTPMTKAKKKPVSSVMDFDEPVKTEPKPEKDDFADFLANLEAQNAAKGIAVDKDVTEKKRSKIKESCYDLTAKNSSEEEEEWIHPMFKLENTKLSKAYDESERNFSLVIEESPKMNRALGLGRIQESESEESSEEETLEQIMNRRNKNKVEAKPDPSFAPPKPKLTPFTPFSKKKKIVQETPKIETSKVEPPKIETPKIETPKPKVEPPKPVIKVEPKIEPPKPKIEPPKPVIKFEPNIKNQEIKSAFLPKTSEPTRPKLTPFTPFSKKKKIIPAKVEESKIESPKPVESPKSTYSRFAAPKSNSPSDSGFDSAREPPKPSTLTETPKLTPVTPMTNITKTLPPKSPETPTKSIFGRKIEPDTNKPTPKSKTTNPFKTPSIKNKFSKPDEVLPSGGTSVKPMTTMTKISIPKKKKIGSVFDKKEEEIEKPRIGLTSIKMKSKESANKPLEIKPSFTTSSVFGKSSKKQAQVTPEPTKIPLFQESPKKSPKLAKKWGNQSSAITPESSTMKSSTLNSSTSKSTFKKPESLAKSLLTHQNHRIAEAYEADASGNESELDSSFKPIPMDLNSFASFLRKPSGDHNLDDDCEAFDYFKKPTAWELHKQAQEEEKRLKRKEEDAAFLQGLDTLIQPGDDIEKKWNFETLMFQSSIV